MDPVSAVMAEPMSSEADPVGHARVTLYISALAVLAVFLDTTVLFVAFPNIVASFPDVGATGLSWVLNAYTIVYAALLVPAGKMSDRFGHKRTFLWGSVVFTVASLVCAVAPDPWTLVLARALQAVGGALLIPASLALIIRATPREDLPVAVATWGAVGAVSGAVGPTLGAALIAALGWRGVFYLNLPVGLFTLYFGRRHLLESSDATAEIPAWSGVVLVAVGAGLTSLGFVQSEAWGWFDPRTMGAITGGIFILVVFAYLQTRSEAPVIEPSLFLIRNFLWANAASVAIGVSFTAMFLGSILYLTKVWQWSIFAAGLGVAPGPTLVAFAAPRLGAFSARIGQRPIILAGGMIYAIGGTFWWMWMGTEPNYFGAYLPGMLLCSLGLAMVIPQLSSTVARCLPQNRLGVGSATNQAVRQFAGTFGVALVIAFVSGAATPEAAVAGFDRAWLMIIFGGLCTTLLALPLRTSP